MLVDQVNKETGVAKEKVKFRIEKLASRGELLIKDDIVSKVFSSEGQMDKTFDEIYETGPITLARKDNVITLRSEYGKESIDEIRKRAKANLPVLKKDIEEGLENIEKRILDDYDPLDVTAYVTTKNMLIDPEIDTESSFRGKQLLPEIVQNIVLRNSLEKYAGVNRKDIDKFHELTNSLATKLNAFLLVEALARDDLASAEAEVYFSMMNDFLWVRGDAYPQHYREVSSELFSKINDVLKTKGYTIEEYWTTVDEINDQIQYNFNVPLKKLRLEHEKFIEFVRNEAEKGIEPNEIIGKYQQEAAERIKSLEPDLKKLSEIAFKGSFEIESNHAINQRLLDSLSMTFGENTSWATPFDKSNIVIKPVIRVNEKYYCFLTPHLIRNVIPIIESQLTQDDRDKTAYSDIKGGYFEAKAIQLLNKVIMGKAYSDLTYQKDKEIDGVIVANDLLFLIEVKGKKKRTIAGVSDVMRLAKDDFRAHIVEAFSQTNRAFDYIQSKDEVEFKDRNGTVALRIRKDTIKKVYKIIVCLENFSKLAIDLNLVKAWIPDLMESSEYPWIVDIYDLMVISDFLEKENTAFITYLNERLEVAENSTLGAIDEIDYLGYFLKNGNLQKLKNVNPANFTLIVGFSEEMDRWYSYLRGEVAKAEKPCLKK